ncbi:MAG: aromatic ring-hydroxylating dioxygenase subunit alpha, partial [Acidimicrobiales bacterium]
TDRGTEVWREPVENYRSQERLERERAMIRKLPMPFCPSHALKQAGDFVAREAATTPLIVVRGKDGRARAFVNACRHRGTQLVSGEGCVGAFVCPYHGWSYGLDGGLLGVPHSDGFPDMDKLEHGLAEIDTIEQNGLIYVVQEGESASVAHLLDDLPTLFSSDQHIFKQGEMSIDGNWKLYLESFIEGYHIKPAHGKTFYPFGFDNLNVIEFCGPHSRVTYPFRRIEKLAKVRPAERDITGSVTYLYHLFPNVIVSKLSHHMSLGVIEPLSPSKTKITFYHLTNPTEINNLDAACEAADRDLDFVNETGQQEDIALVEGIQRSLHTNANQVLTFGEFEPAIVHFHTQLAQHLTTD